VVEEALFAILTTDAPLSALVSNRIYPNKLPQNVTYPAIAYRQVAELTQTMFEPPGTNGQVAVRFRFFSVSEEREQFGYTEAKRIDEALRVALVGKYGTFSGVEIQGIFLESVAADDYEDTTETYQVIRDFTVYAVR